MFLSHVSGILVFRVFRNTHKKMLKLLHGGINAAGLFFTLLAAIAVIENHNQGNTPHLYTMHSWVGVIAVTLYVIQVSNIISSFILFGYLPVIRPMAI